MSVAVGKYPRPETFEFSPVGLSHFQWEKRDDLHRASIEEAVSAELVAKRRAEELAREAQFQTGSADQFVDHTDLYRILGLSHRGLDATEDEIRAAHKLAMVRLHPDKDRAGAYEKTADGHLEEKGLFQVVTKAFETLLDQQRRWEYDSKWGHIDDRVPSEKEAAKKDFFELFGPVFARNARWSKKKPVPELGNKDTPYEQVEAFYSFWFGFQSWREFTDADEHKEIPLTDPREERRYKMAQNKKKRDQAKAVEVKRLGDLVELAERFDPRVKAFQEAEKEKRNAGKNAKAKAKEEEKLAKEKAKADAKAAEEAAKKAAEEAKIKEKADKEAATKHRKTVRKTLRDFAVAAGLAQEQIEIVTSRVPIPELEAINAELQALPEAKRTEKVNATFAHAQTLPAAKAE